MPEPRRCQCGSKIRVPDRLSDQDVFCPRCGVRVPPVAVAVTTTWQPAVQILDVRDDGDFSPAFDKSPSRAPASRPDAATTWAVAIGLASLLVALASSGDPPTPPIPRVLLIPGLLWMGFVLHREAMRRGWTASRSGGVGLVVMAAGFLVRSLAPDESPGPAYACIYLSAAMCYGAIGLWGAAARVAWRAR